MKSSKIRVGVLGCGNVGGALVQLVAERGQAIADRTGLEFEIAAVAVRNTAIARPGVTGTVRLTRKGDCAEAIRVNARQRLTATIDRIPRVQRRV